MAINFASFLLLLPLVPAALAPALSDFSKDYRLPVTFFRIQSCSFGWGLRRLVELAPATQFWRTQRASPAFIDQDSHAPEYVMIELLS